MKEYEKIIKQIKEKRLRTIDQLKPYWGQHFTEQQSKLIDLIQREGFGITVTAFCQAITEGKNVDVLVNENIKYLLNESYSSHKKPLTGLTWQEVLNLNAAQINILSSPAAMTLLTRSSFFAKSINWRDLVKMSSNDFNAFSEKERKSDAARRHLFWNVKRVAHNIFLFCILVVGILTTIAKTPRDIEDLTKGINFLWRNFRQLTGSSEDIKINNSPTTRDALKATLVENTYQKISRLCKVAPLSEQSPFFDTYLTGLCQNGPQIPYYCDSEEGKELACKALGKWYQSRTSDFEHPIAKQLGGFVISQGFGGFIPAVQGNKDNSDKETPKELSVCTKNSDDAACQLNH